jgi:hypothetical protein
MMGMVFVKEHPWVGIRKFSVNEHYWDSVDTANKAYWLGFIYADGHVNNNRVRIMLSSKDEDHLRKFIKEINYTGNIKFSTTNKGHSATYVDICHLLFRRGIKKYLDYKSKTFDAHPPVLDDELMPHFWRGVFDGDGYLRVKTKAGKPNYRFSCTGNKQTMQALMQFLISRAGVNEVKLYKTHTDTWTVSYSGRKNLIKIINVLASTEHAKMDRKWDKVSDLMDIYHT